MDQFSKKLNVRPWGDFAELDRFSIPDAQVKERCETNLDYYSGNYAIIVGVVLLLTLFTNYSLLFAVVVLAGVGFFLFVQQPRSYTVGGVVVTKTIQLVVYTLITVYWVYKVSGLTLFYTTLVALLTVLAHSATRKRSVKSKVNKALNDLSDN
ncbi:PRA1 family protein 2 [Cavenderia fasciculata]|uniref:PRA1 family protein n=1 Tax=Cavenderia fasciculata TaxID=261658 RepID=F4Q529_CACFS|nr:PRA1 family protein 2 [Cavenderia fasciculata]EGG17922.1 PRA1 family protein 2 [Cavenderia fasciculata]|eukprot:XP_004356406.1 PRA1 family protein 2 [Cavenderia fasciculata]